MLGRIKTLEELAEDAFVKQERVNMLEIQNTPSDYEERKKAFVELVFARKAAAEAIDTLLRATEARSLRAEQSEQ